MGLGMITQIDKPITQMSARRANLCNRLNICGIILPKPFLQHFRSNVSQLIQIIEDFGFWISDCSLFKSAFRIPQSVTQYVRWSIPAAVPTVTPPVPRSLRLQRSLRPWCFWTGCLMLSLGVVGLWPVPLSLAEPLTEEGDDTIAVTKEVTGTISTLPPPFLSVVYRRDAKKGIEWEMPLQVGKSTELRYKRSLSELQRSDTVSVQYVEKQRVVKHQGKDGSPREETQVVSREAQIIIFLRPAKQGLMSGPAE